MKLRVCIAGATGWVGRELCKEIAGTGDLELVGAVARTDAGKSLREILGDGAGDAKLSATASEALKAPTDVLVDYTKPDAVKANVFAAIERGVNVVIGTSGLTDADFAEIERAASDKGVGVIAAGNFAITAVLMQRFAAEAAKYLNHWEIVEYGAAMKPDAPSGTTRELVNRLAQIKPPEIMYPLEKTMGVIEARGATMDGMQVHSVRLPGFTIAVEIIFGETDERLTIRHDAGGSAEPYLAGTLLAIRKVKEVKGLIRGLDKILD